MLKTGSRLRYPWGDGAGSLETSKNKDVIISGLTIGILGYAFGTYLGIIIATILH